MEKKADQGLIQIYTGEGKGKSTAAFGLALRASGCGLKTVIVQFMKNGQGFGELKSFSLLPDIDVYSFGNGVFLSKGVTPDTESLTQARLAMNKVREVLDDDVDILILDELNNAVYFDLISEDEVLSVMEDKPSSLELVITGRNATKRMIDKADLVTDMREIKHPYRQGIEARKGIEY